MKLVTPNYSKRTPVFNDNHFTDGPAMPTANSVGFDPGQSAAPMPNGPPRFISPPGKRVVGTKGLTQKRQTSNL